MTDYTELVKALRFCFTPAGKGCGYCPAYKSEKTGRCRIGLDAADAIEALQAEVERLTTENKELIEDRPEMVEADGHWEWRKPNGEVLMPKRGEWIDDEFTSKGRCSVCGEEWSWFDNCMETFKYCPNCGAKMEVQDESAGSL